MRILLLAILLLPACATLKEGFGGEQEHKPLLEQVLIMAQGHAGLINQICRKRNWFGECSEMDRLEYSLDDAETRANLVKLDFVCKIAGKHYFINPDAAEFIRRERGKTCWLCKEETKIVDVISFSKTQLLIDSATVCWSEKTYPGGIR